MTTFYGWSTAPGAGDDLQAPTTSSTHQHGVILRQYQWNYAALAKNVSRYPIFVKSGNPISPAVVKVGPNTKIRLVSHTFDSDNALTPFNIRYILYYTLNGSGGSECNLFDVDLSKIPTTKILFSSSAMASCTVYLLNKDAKISDHVSRYGEVDAFTITVKQLSGPVIVNENCLNVIIYE